MSRFTALLVLPVLVLAGCATTVSTPTTISSEALRASDTIDGAVNFEFSTDEPDERIALTNLNAHGEPVKRVGESWRVRHNDALSSMFSQYMGQTFSGTGERVDVELRLLDVDLVKFEQEVQGRPATARAVRQSARLVVKVDGRSHVKMLDASSSTAAGGVAINWNADVLADASAQAPSTEATAVASSSVPGLTDGRSSMESATADAAPEDVVVIQGSSTSEARATSNPGAQSGVGDLTGVGEGTAAMNSYEGRGEEADELARLLNETSNALLIQAAEYLRSLDL